MVIIPEGTFLMGCDAGEDNERPVHRVWIDSFGLGKFPVTNCQYRKISRIDRHGAAALLVGADVYRSA